MVASGIRGIHTNGRVLSGGMGRQPVFYERPIALNRERHAHLRVNPGVGFGFARHTPALGIAAVEFEKAAREYPIVFVADGESIYPAVVLGVHQDENLFVDGEGRWLGGYIPAYVRRYPFILAHQAPEDRFAVCIDEAFGGWDEREGEPLFLDSGEQSPYLRRSVEFLREFQVQHERTREFSEHVRSLELVEPMQANISMSGGEQLSLTGFLVVNRDKVKALDADKLAGLIKTDQLELLYQHLFSLANFSRLVDRLGAVKS